MKHYYLLLLFFIASIQAATSQQVVSVVSKGNRSLAQMQTLYGAIIQNGIDIYKVTYTTPDAFGQPDTASGLLIVPVRQQSSSYPILVYQHGTVSGPTDVPSELRADWEIAAIFGGMGYVSLAPDYLGLGESRGFHPYVHAATEASAALDMIRACKAHMPSLNVAVNDQLFITGYSQGGHAAAALHREIEANHTDEFSVTAAAHLSGPYSISRIMKERILTTTPYFYPAYVPNTFLSYNYVYQIYNSIESVFKPAYVPLIQSYYDRQISLTALNLQLIIDLTQNTGASVARNMLQDSIVAILETEQPADHPLLEALRDNDVYNWGPQAPTRLFYCQADDQVPYLNSVLADSVMRTYTPPNFDSANLNPTANHGQCVQPAVTATIVFFGGFQDIQVGLTESPVMAALQLFPNPAAEHIFLKGIEGEVAVGIYDQQGKLVRFAPQQDSSQPVSLAGLPVGMYVVRIASAQGIASRKLVIQP